jgi:uncharacterized protein YjbJ (UPF0337 family)
MDGPKLIPNDVNNGVSIKEVDDMNWDQVKGNWKQLKGKAQQAWGDLTDDDLDVIEGKREELVGRLQAKYGYTKEKAEQEADSWVKKLFG